VTTNDLSEQLSSLGLNEYEARVYLALLGADAMTAYELGKRASVPLSRCYEVARSLAAKGLALAQPGQTPRYRAVDPALAVEAQRRRLEALGAALQRHAQRDDREPLWTLRGRGPILAAAAALVETATERVALWAPPDALDELAGALATARARGLAVESGPDGALALLVDDAEALLGELDPPERALAAHLRQPAVVAWLAARAAARPVEPDAEAAWIDWESRKVRRLLASVPALSRLEET
jgi:sugar-specific transcriptional regulator TrmB